MHQYMRAIGFGNVNTKKELYNILNQVEEEFTCHELVFMEEESDFCEYQKEYGVGIGVSVCGDLDLSERFRKQYYFPYFIGTGVTSYADVTIERRIDREAYVGICEDSKVGINLIFYLQNPIQYLKEKQICGENVRYSSVTLAGLCNSGTILLPVMKNEMQEKQQKEDVSNRTRLMAAAKEGDPQAIEHLTLEDIDTYSKVSKRLITEDIFSIVDTYIMPYGIECDCYSILGEILSLYPQKNDYSGELVYVMRLDVNGLIFDICVPRNGLIGEPAVGRRFKANMWLQGMINF